MSFDISVSKPHLRRDLEAGLKRIVSGAEDSKVGVKYIGRCTISPLLFCCSNPYGLVLKKANNSNL